MFRGQMNTRDKSKTRKSHSQSRTEARDLENHIKVADRFRILEWKDREKKEENYSNKEFPNAI